MKVAFKHALVYTVIAAIVAVGTSSVAEEGEAEEQPRRRAYAVKSEKLSIIDSNAFEQVARFAIPDGKPVHHWINSDKTRLAVILQDGIIGNKPVNLVVVDLEKDEIVNTVQLGYDAVKFIVADDGNRAYVGMNGKTFRGKPSVVAIDTTSGTISSKVVVRSLPDELILSQSEDRLFFIDKGINALNPKYREAATIVSYDSAKLEKGEKTALPGSVTELYLDYPGRLYFLNRGVDHKNKKLRLQGMIYAVDRETLEVIDGLEVGMAPSQLAWDADLERFYLLNSPWATQNNAAAQLQLIGADGIEAAIDLPRRPLGAQPSLDREHFYVLYADDVFRVDKELKKAEKFLDLKDSPVQLFEHPDNGHFYATHFDSSEISIVSGSTGKTLRRVTTGSMKGRATKLAAAAAAQVAVTGLVVAAGPSHRVNGTNYYQVPIVNPMEYGKDYQRTFGSFSEDGKVFYVFNAATNDVNVIDTLTNKIVAKVPGGEYDIKTFNDSKTLLTVAAGYTRFFDATNNYEKVAQYDSPSETVQRIPGTNKAYFTHFLGRAVYVVDLENFGELSTVKDAVGNVIAMTER